MAADLLTQLQSLYNQQNTWRLNGRHIASLEDNMRAFGGSGWPPRTYSCSFCTREFRSAQALGGHMNVHRRDRARLHHPDPDASISNATSGVSFSFAATPMYLAEKGLLDLMPVKAGLVRESGAKYQGIVDDCTLIDEVDLELRLGW